MLNSSILLVFLEGRRQISYLILLFKIVNGLYANEFTRYFSQVKKKGVNLCHRDNMFYVFPTY